MEGNRINKNHFVNDGGIQLICHNYKWGGEVWSYNWCFGFYNIFDKSSDQLDIHIVGITQSWFVGETAAQKIHGIYRMFLLKSFWNFWPLNRWTGGICVMNKKNRISCSSFCVKNISLFPGIIGSVFGWEHILFCGSGGNKLIVCIHSCQCCNTQKKKFFCAFFHGNPPCI